MPKSRKPPQDPLDQIARLPRRRDVTIVGGRLTLQITPQQPEDQGRPQLVVWMEDQSRMICGSDVIDLDRSADEGATEAVDLLIQGLLGQELPILSAPSGLPGKIVVADAALRETIRERFAAYQVDVELASEAPLVKETMRGLLRSMGLDEHGAPPPPFAWDAPLAVLAPLYKAAASLWRRAPWDYLLDHPPLMVALGKHGPTDEAETLHVSILGAAGTVFGVACYFTPEDFRLATEAGEAIEDQEETLYEEAKIHFRQRGMPVDLIPEDVLRQLVTMAINESGAMQPAQNALVCYFEEQEDTDPTYLSWMNERDLKSASKHAVPTFFRMSRDAEPRQPDERETRALTLVIEAINQFVTRHKTALEEGPDLGKELALQAKAGQATVPVSLIITDEKDLLFPPGARTTLYRFHVALEWDKEIWRRIEMPGDLTLYDLHRAIQEAFGWDNDHLYAFFLSGKAWDAKSEIEGDPMGGGGADDVMLQQLNLHQRQKILYIFDFGDDLRHIVRVEKIIPDGVDAKLSYPLITEKHGEAPPQYPDWEEEDEDESGDE